jgi:hypothetical protein
MESTGTRAHMSPSDRADFDIEKLQEESPVRTLKTNKYYS